MEGDDEEQEDNGDEDLEIKNQPVDNEDDAWCQCVSGEEEEEGGESLSIQNWPYPTTTSTRYTYPPLKPPPNTTQIHKTRKHLHCTSYIEIII